MIRLISIAVSTVRTMWVFGGGLMFGANDTNVFFFLGFTIGFLGLDMLETATNKVYYAQRH